MTEVMLINSVLLSFDPVRNQAVFTRTDGEDSLINPAQACTMMGISMRNTDTLDEVAAFAEHHGIEPVAGMNIETAEAYNTNRAAQVGSGIMKSAYPIYTQIFPDEITNDGFYGNTPVDTERTLTAVTAITLDELVTTLFGEKRKDLVKAIVKQKYPNKMFWASLFTGALPIDWIIDYLVKPTHYRADFGFTAKAGQITAMLSHLDRFQTRRLLNDDSEEGYLIAEAARIFSAIPESAVSLPSKITTRELHDHFTLLSKGGGEDIQFDIPEDIERLDASVAGEFTAKVLRNRSEYKMTGEVMQNCVGTLVYSLDTLDSKNSIIRFDDVNGTPKYLLELKRRGGGWVVNQLEGIANTEVPEPHKILIHQMIEREINHVTTKSY